VSLAPGRYVISAPRSGSLPKTVTLRSGETLTVNFPNFCAQQSVVHTRTSAWRANSVPAGSWTGISPRPDMAGWPGPAIGRTERRRGSEGMAPAGRSPPVRLSASACCRCSAAEVGAYPAHAARPQGGSGAGGGRRAGEEKEDEQTPTPGAAPGLRPPRRRPGRKLAGELDSPPPASRRGRASSPAWRDPDPVDTAGSHIDERPCHSPDLDEQRAQPRQRSQTDLDGSGCPHMEPRVRWPAP
jgi:hypothetical protein